LKIGVRKDKKAKRFRFFKENSLKAHIYIKTSLTKI